MSSVIPVPPRTVLSSETVTPAPETTRRLYCIDAIRGFAALNIVVFHSLGAHAPGTLFGPLDAVLGLTRVNPVHVNIFFVVSGWCICGVIMRAALNSRSSWSFFRDRALRIFPLYWTVIALALILRLAAMPFNHTAMETNFHRGIVEVIGDLFLLQPYLETRATLLVSWTLVYEIGFYALAAMGLAALRQKVAAHWVLLSASLLCLVSLTPFQPKVLMITRLWPEFMVGVVAWFLSNDSSRKITTWICVPVVVAANVIPAFHSSWPAHASVLGVGALLIVANRYDAALSSLSLVRGLAWVGVFSYSLYLIHVPVLSPFINLAGRFIPVDSAAYVGVWLAGLMLALASAWLLYRWVEAPVERWRKNLSRARV